MRGEARRSEIFEARRGYPCLASYPPIWSENRLASPRSDSRNSKSPRLGTAKFSDFHEARRGDSKFLRIASPRGWADMPRLGSYEARLEEAESPRTIRSEARFASYGLPSTASLGIMEINMTLYRWNEAIFESQIWTKGRGSVFYPSSPYKYPRLFFLLSSK